MKEFCQNGYLKFLQLSKWILVISVTNFMFTNRQYVVTFYMAYSHMGMHVDSEYIVLYGVFIELFQGNGLPLPNNYHQPSDVNSSNNSVTSGYQPGLYLFHGVKVLLVRHPLLPVLVRPHSNPILYVSDFSVQFLVGPKSNRKI